MAKTADYDLGEFTFHSDFNFIDLAPKSEKEVYIKTKNIYYSIVF